MYKASGTARGRARGTGTNRGRGIGNSIMMEEAQFGQGTRGQGRHGVQYVRVGGTRGGRGQFVAPTRERGQFESFIGRSQSTSFGTRGGGQTFASAGRGRSQFIAPTRGKGQPTSFGNGGGQALPGIERRRGQYVNRATRITQVTMHSTISTEATASQPISKASDNAF
ncbi:uncharacterized protein LOC121049626 [Rosa chinensis]|nr:uncharacterized protein LOC121049626 [Rosa chinensis]